MVQLHCYSEFRALFSKKKIVNKNGRIDIINKLLSEFRAPTVIYKHVGNASEKR